MSNYDLEMAWAEDFALESAGYFISGYPWVMDKTIQRLADDDGLDPDAMELALAVLFPSAVVHVATGGHIV
jgi:hypothetical protein